MAQIIEERVFDDNTCVLFNELENGFDWLTVYGTDDEKIFRISANLAIKFTNFASANTSGSATSYAYIYAVIGTTDIQLLRTNGLSLRLRFRLVIGAAGDLALQLLSSVSAIPTIPVGGTDLIFAIVNVQNTVNDSITGYGIYVPKAKGDANSLGAGMTFMNATPRFMYTDDTDDLIENGNLQFLTYDPEAKITALIPIVCVASQCVSTSAYVPIVSKPDIQQGYVEIEGVLYYRIGGLHFIETEQGG